MCYTPGTFKLTMFETKSFQLDLDYLSKVRLLTTHIILILFSFFGTHIKFSAS